MRGGATQQEEDASRVLHGLPARKLAFLPVRSVCALSASSCATAAALRCWLAAAAAAGAFALKRAVWRANHPADRTERAWEGGRGKGEGQGRAGRSGKKGSLVLSQFRLSDAALARLALGLFPG